MADETQTPEQMTRTDSVLDTLPVAEKPLKTYLQVDNIGLNYDQLSRTTSKPSEGETQGDRKQIIVELVDDCAGLVNTLANDHAAAAKLDSVLKRLRLNFLDQKIAAAGIKGGMQDGEDRHSVIAALDQLSYNATFKPDSLNLFIKYDQGEGIFNRAAQTYVLDQLQDEQGKPLEELQKPLEAYLILAQLRHLSENKREVTKEQLVEMVQRIATKRED